MSFVDIRFLFFFPLVVILHFLLPERFRWMWLLGASYIFYMAWRPEYALLLATITVIDFTAGIVMSRSSDTRVRKAALVTSLVANLGILFFFKYFNFFFASIGAGLAAIGTTAHLPVLDIILPIGISFHIFQSVSYTIDVYKRTAQPVTHLGKFALYVSFFPQLVAGPIERPNGLLVQFFEKRRFDALRAHMGVLLMLLGYFKKLVIADNLAPLVNTVYSSPENFTGPSLMIATVLFAFQIYCDFSGYTDIARGTAKILGYDLAVNFDRPYLSKSITEFWRRWHISLSSWLRDYLYISLGGNRKGSFRTYLNLLTVFILCGLWHGANVTYVVWGLWQGVFLIIERLGMKEWLEKNMPYIQQPIMFVIISIGWVFFRSNSLGEARYILNHFFVGIPEFISKLSTAQGIAEVIFMNMPWYGACIGVLGVGVLIYSEYITATVPSKISLLDGGRLFRSTFYGACVILIMLLGTFVHSGQFIYFQF